MEVFSHYFFEYLFSPTIFLVSFWESDDISVSIFCYCATVPSTFPLVYQTE